MARLALHQRNGVCCVVRADMLLAGQVSEVVSAVVQSL
jgi:hypothetical protein